MLDVTDGGGYGLNGLHYPAHQSITTEYLVRTTDKDDQLDNSESIAPVLSPDGRPRIRSSRYSTVPPASWRDDARYRKSRRFWGFSMDRCRHTNEKAFLDALYDRQRMCPSSNSLVRTQDCLPITGNRSQVM